MIKLRKNPPAKHTDKKSSGHVLLLILPQYRQHDQNQPNPNLRIKQTKKKPPLSSPNHFPVTASTYRYIVPTIPIAKRPSPRRIAPKIAPGTAEAARSRGLLIAVVAQFPPAPWRIPLTECSLQPPRRRQAASIFEVRTAGRARARRVSPRRAR